MIVCGARCSTKHSRSSWLPGPASRSLIGASTTSSMMCSSCRGPCNSRGVPVWAAVFPGNVKPLRRAARYDGLFPVNLDNVDQFARPSQPFATCAVITLRLMTSPSSFLLAPMSPRTPRQAPPGGWPAGTRNRVGRGARCDSRWPGGMTGLVQTDPRAAAPSGEGRELFFTRSGCLCLQQLDAGIESVERQFALGNLINEQPCTGDSTVNKVSPVPAPTKCRTRSAGSSGEDRELRHRGVTRTTLRRPPTRHFLHMRRSAQTRKRSACDVVARTNRTRRHRPVPSIGSSTEVERSALPKAARSITDGLRLTVIVRPHTSSDCPRRPNEMLQNPRKPGQMDEKDSELYGIVGD